jgi:ATP-dependent helicase/nuclease subunit B
LDRLLAIGRRRFQSVGDRPGVWAFWWPRFERVARWFVETERGRRAGIAASFGEVPGRLVVGAAAVPFELTAKADRIDVVGRGLEIIDYKSGALPGKQDIARGYAPQLPLEAAIAAAGGFDGVAPAPPARLAYWRLTGGDPPGEIKELEGDPAALAAGARARLEALIAAFDDPATPYLSRPSPLRAPRYSDYAHLARVKEWSAGTGGEAE